MLVDRRGALKLCTSSILLPTVSAFADTSYPNRPIRIMVPFPAGGPIDGVPRVIARQLGQRLNWTAVVENRPGANGRLGVLPVKQAPPDGYTIGVITSLTHGSAPALKTDIPYDAIGDFTPIVLLAEGAMAVVVRNEVPAHSLKEFVDLLSARPGTLNFSSAGPLSQNYLAAIMLFQRAGLPANAALHVPYPGIAPGIASLLSGTVQFMITSTGSITSSDRRWHVARTRAYGLTALATPSEFAYHR